MIDIPKITNDVSIFIQDHAPRYDYYVYITGATVCIEMSKKCNNGDIVAIKKHIAFFTLERAVMDQSDVIILACKDMVGKLEGVL